MVETKELQPSRVLLEFQWSESTTCKGTDRTNEG